MKITLETTEDGDINFSCDAQDDDATYDTVLKKVSKMFASAFAVMISDVSDGDDYLKADIFNQCLSEMTHTYKNMQGDKGFKELDDNDYDIILKTDRKRVEHLIVKETFHPKVLIKLLSRSIARIGFQSRNNIDPQKIKSIESSLKGGVCETVDDYIMYLFTKGYEDACKFYSRLVCAVSVDDGIIHISDIKQ